MESKQKSGEASEEKGNPIQAMHQMVSMAGETPAAKEEDTKTESGMLEYFFQTWIFKNSKILTNFRRYFQKFKNSFFSKHFFKQNYIPCQATTTPATEQEKKE